MSESNASNSTAAVQATDEQQVFFSNHSDGIDFQLDIYDSPKRQFAILAKKLGWVGGEEQWNTHWRDCFQEEYVWRQTARNTGNVRNSGNTGHSGGIDNATLSSDRSTPAPSDKGSSASASENAGGIWAGFDGFTPDPGAPFNSEFYGLAKSQGWSREERQKRRLEMFDADFHAHFGNDIGDLEEWQKFCRLCGVEPVPDNIPGCISALEVLYVNIYDILDSKRADMEVHVFDDFDDFVAYTIDGHVYPLEEAKMDTFMPVFLKELPLR